MFPADPAVAPGPPGSGPQDPAPGAAGPGMPDGARDGSANGWQAADGGPPAPPPVSLPKGGGAIRDIGEKFSVSAATGTASLTIPVADQPRAGRFRPFAEP